VIAVALNHYRPRSSAGGATKDVEIAQGDFGWGRIPQKLSQMMAQFACAATRAAILQPSAEFGISCTAV
jgi:hypothetical protein